MSLFDCRVHIHVKVAEVAVAHAIGRVLINTTGVLDNFSYLIIGA